jgi:nucleoside-diphosphate-sugar epimerase
MAVVVTGASGFIGSHLVEHVHRAGYAVVGLDRRPPPAGQRGVHLELDLLDLEPPVSSGPAAAARDALADAEAVWHLAGCPGVRSAAPDWAAPDWAAPDMAAPDMAAADRAAPDREARRWRDNVVATELVASAVPLSVPLLVASSSSVYGGSIGDRPSSECDRLAPRGSYAASKVAAEERCAARAARGGHVCVARPFTVVGERQRPDMALARWLHAAHRGSPLVVFGSTARRRDLTDVHHVARALVELLERGASGPVNVGTGRSVTLGEMIAAVAAALGLRPEVQVVEAAAEEVAANLADVGRLRRLLDWAPETDLDAVVGRQVAAAAGSRPSPEPR